MAVRKASISAGFLASLLERFSNNLVPAGSDGLSTGAASALLGTQDAQYPGAALTRIQISSESNHAPATNLKQHLRRQARRELLVESRKRAITDKLRDSVAATDSFRLSSGADSDSASFSQQWPTVDLFKGAATRAKCKARTIQEFFLPALARQRHQSHYGALHAGRPRCAREIRLSCRAG